MLAAAEDWQLDVEMEEEEDATGIERKRERGPPPISLIRIDVGKK